MQEWICSPNDHWHVVPCSQPSPTHRPLLCADLCWALPSVGGEAHGAFSFLQQGRLPATADMPPVDTPQPESSWGTAQVPLVCSVVGQGWLGKGPTTSATESQECRASEKGYVAFCVWTRGRFRLRLSFFPLPGPPSCLPPMMFSCSLL